MRGLLHQLGRIRVRLLVVNLVVVLVPVAGLEFANLYERQLLDALERDMRNQAILSRRMIEEGLEAGLALSHPGFGRAITRAAADTRTRIRILDGQGVLVQDSHADGPPEGPEPPPPSILDPVGLLSRGSSAGRRRWSAPEETWPDVPERLEVREARRGQRSAFTRVRERSPAVFLFLTEPVLEARHVVGVVYVTRSTTPVLQELYRIRRGLYAVLAAAMLFTLLVTLVLAWSISRPLAKLSRAARRIASGQRDVEVPVGGGGEIRELGESFRAMTQELDARLRYISEFAADVAHEFKSPLTSIRGAAELLGEGAADDPEARDRFLRNIELDADRLDRLVSRLLELSRIEASNVAPTLLDLEALLRAAAERASGPDVHVDVDYRASARILEGRQMDLTTALLNLLDNAVRFSPPGGRVAVLCEDDGLGFVRIGVRDEGPGVPPEMEERVFERFFSTDPEGDGTGLGLAIVRAVAHAHGGQAWARATPDGGLFIVRLPLRRGDRRP